MTSKIEHLYIHIPFCKNICAYCDFVRQLKEDKIANAYIKRVIDEVKRITHKLTTIYIGGGTPNCLDNKQLNLLLKHARMKLNDKYEFTIELNPEFVTMQQAMILKANGVNRVSIGAQTTNNTILYRFNRQHSLKHVIQAISNLKKVGINNINLDFMYGFNEMKKNDITNAIDFIKTYKIKHVS
jgi:oxygen-independent coproporphyrinogen-3 oxidase